MLYLPAVKIVMIVEWWEWNNSLARSRYLPEATEQRFGKITVADILT